MVGQLSERFCYSYVRRETFPASAHAAQLSQIVDLRDYISQTLICESLTLALTLSATSASAYLRSTPQGVGRRSISSHPLEMQ